ncbi:DNA-binding transcriptional ArsR family regulator [Mumia flava]|uniref:DNA-binding transcriptional ArsR family regulator n=1 Tax=Mumia flava TaxID=1348852 RepID=A0A0B2B914_9ACTN|nr:metalloregulator ArsR/SmtB family transcription factor [Mumia flava]PJJ53428.1 DNA-binding transcriptional ArsR family regulator [Mumia flava]
MSGRSAGALFDALGDPVRRVVLGLVSAGETPAGEIVAAVQQHAPMSQPAVSQHLRVLRDAGLVSVRADGTKRLYAVDPEAVSRARAWLESLVDPLAGIEQPLDALATEVARGRRAARRAAPAATRAEDAAAEAG